MARIDFQPPRPHQLLGVYRDEATAQRVLLDLREKASEWTARRGDNTDEQVSLNAEMAEEMKESFISPQASLVLTKESASFAKYLFPLAILAGIAIMFPLSFLWPGAPLSIGARVAMMVFVGGTLGGTVAAVWLAAGVKKPSEPMAAERGVIVRVPDDTDELRRLMIAAKPIRLDVVDDQGRPIETLATEGDSSSLEEIGKRVDEST